MSADLYTAALAAIEARRELIEAGTPGPWTRYGMAGVAAPDWEIVEERRIECPDCQEAVALTGCATNEDAALIVAGVNAFAAAIDHAESVLEVWHAPGTSLDSGAPRCRGDHSLPVQAWPCPDARAALTFLGVE